VKVSYTSRFAATEQPNDLGIVSRQIGNAPAILPLLGAKDAFS
jgi:hypothetical protein